jgi:spermidine/putrescine transport system permease protein
MKKSSRIILPIYILLVYAFLYVPIVVVSLFSFNEDRISSSWKGFTLKWYQKLFQNIELIEAFKDSLIIATFAAIIASIIGTLAAYALAKYNFNGKKYFEVISNLPLITPDIITGIGLLSFFLFCNFSLSLYSILLAHITFNIAFVLVIVKTRFDYLGEDLENAAKDLGANSIQAFWYIIIPNILPGILAGFMIAFTLSWNDFMIAFLQSGPGVTTLPVKVFSMLRYGVDPQVNAISFITILFSFILLLITLRFQKANKFI